MNFVWKPITCIDLLFLYLATNEPKVPPARACNLQTHINSLSPWEHNSCIYSFYLSFFIFFFHVRCREGGLPRSPRKIATCFRALVKRLKACELSLLLSYILAQDLKTHFLTFLPAVWAPHWFADGQMVPRAHPQPNPQSSASPLHTQAASCDTVKGRFLTAAVKGSSTIHTKGNLHLFWWNHLDFP